MVLDNGNYMHTRQENIAVRLLMSQLPTPQNTAQTSESKPNNFIRFLRYVVPYKHLVIMGAIGGIVKFTVPLIVPQVTRHLIDNVYLDSTLTANAKLGELALYVGGMMAVFIIFWAPWVFARHYFASKAGQRSVFDLRYDLYDKILHMSTSFFQRNKSGSIVSRLISDISLAQNLVGSALTNIWIDGAAVIVILGFLLSMNVNLTIVALATFPIYIYVWRKLRHQIQSTSHQVQEEIAELAGNVQEKITGNQVVHSFNQERSEEQAFYHDSEKLFSTTMRRVRLQSINMMLTGMIIHLAPLIVAIYGGWQVIVGNLTVGQLVAVSLYLTPLYTPLQRFSELNVVFSNSMAALDRVFEIMDEQPEIKDKPRAVELNEIEGQVEFERVTFTYPDALDDDEQGPVLDDISFAISPGQKVAFVGPSGAGKSTIVSLIPRFFDVDLGGVKIDGHDVRDVKVKSLRQHIGMVLQTPILFSGTVLDNIRYGKPNASLEEIVAACRAANAYDFIENLPNGFYSEVGEGGSFLSGGQRQRVTIARAFLKNPKILILDEATSSLDTQSERLIQSALERLMEGRTTLIIAHRLSTIENADRIIVMEDGSIVEQGTHNELLQQTGIYHQLYS
jgi:ATP-binding cassette, subfamily B, putative efflux pump